MSNSTLTQVIESGLINKYIQVKNYPVYEFIDNIKSRKIYIYKIIKWMEYEWIFYSVLQDNKKI